EVLDLQRSHHGTAPLVFGVTGDFRQRGRSAAGAEDVVGSVHEMRHTRNLEQTPSLVDADVTDDVGNMRSAVGVGTGTDLGRSNAEVQHSSAVEHGRIIETD